MIAMDIATDKRLDDILRKNPAVAIGVSGGKDSQAATIAAIHHLDSLGHQGPRILVHADLGMVEWHDSLPVCVRLAEHFGLELAVVHRKAGGLMERWEARWASSARRYTDLLTVTLVPCFSSAKNRFCTSETKTHPITSMLRKRFAGHRIVNVTGIRAEESRRRATAPIWNHDSQLGITHWRPVLGWTMDQVFASIHAAGLEPHEAYGCFQMSRVSCRFCVLSRNSDLQAASRQPEAWPLYRRIVALEAESGFSFQAGRWLGDVAPSLLGPELEQRLRDAKNRAAQRAKAEARIEPDMLYTKGWPTRRLTRREAEILADVRQVVSDIYGFHGNYLTPSGIEERYEELLDLNAERLAKKRSS